MTRQNQEGRSLLLKPIHCYAIGHGQTVLEVLLRLILGVDDTHARR